MKRISILVVISLIICGAIYASNSYALDSNEKRVALIVGNASYKHIGSLRNTINDAVDVANKLRRLNFDIVQIIDGDRSSIVRSLKILDRSLKGADLAFFFYAGHGIAVNGVNYLVPVDADLGSGDVEKQLIAVDEVINVLQREPRTSIVLLDACRDNPFVDQLENSGGRSVQRGLVVMEKFIKDDRHGISATKKNELDILIGFATQPGNIAVDGKPDDRNSPFTKGVINYIEEKIEIRQLLTQVRAFVVKDTDGKQIPWDQSSLMKPIYLAGPPPVDIKKEYVTPKVDFRSMPPP